MTWLKNSTWALPSICFVIAAGLVAMFWWFHPIRGWAMDCTPEDQLLLLADLKSRHLILLFALGFLFFLIYIFQLYVQTYFRNWGAIAHFRTPLRFLGPIFSGVLAFYLINLLGMRNLDDCILDAMNPGTELSGQIGSLTSYLGGPLNNLRGGLLLDQLVAGIVGLGLGWFISWTYWRIYDRPRHRVGSEQ